MVVSQASRPTGTANDPARRTDLTSVGHDHVSRAASRQNGTVKSLTAPTWFIDSESPEVAAFVERSLAAAESDARGNARDDARGKAVTLFLAVRDGIRYDPYGISKNPDDFRASAIAQSPTNWCVPKAVLLTAAARHVGIPARLGFADVRNHLTSEKLSASMGTDLFSWHGYSELLLGDRWFKVSSAFNIELCERVGAKVLDFDGTDDALMHPFDESGNRQMEYVHQRGSFDDLPLDEILADFAVRYPDAMTAGRASDTVDDDVFE
jgi:transglutaminase-like putative cysteine protease